MHKLSQIGLAGLAVMGENLVLNMAGKGFSVAVYNRTTTKIDAFLAGRAKDLPISGFHSVQDFVAGIERPRKVMTMLKAGEPVDQFIDQLLPFLEPGDIEEALGAANAIGDDNLQRQTQGRVVPDAFTHGTGEQRVRWFRRGFETGDFEQGDTFAADRL